MCRIDPELLIDIRYLVIGFFRFARVLILFVEFFAFAKILIFVIEFFAFAKVLIFLVKFFSLAKVLVFFVEFFAFAKILVFLVEFFSLAKVLVSLIEHFSLIKEFLFPEFVHARIVLSVKIIIYAERLCNFPHIFMRFFFFPLQCPLCRFLRFFFLWRDHAFDLIDQPLDIRRQDRLCCFLSLHIPCHFPF